MTPEPLCTIVHMRQLKICASGGRAWAKRHGLDWSTFATKGLPVSQFDQVGDDYARRMAALARAEAGAA